MPNTVHKRIDEFFEIFSRVYEIYQKDPHLQQMVLGNFIEELINKMENGVLKPIRAVRKIQNLVDWANILVEGAEKDIYIDSSVTEDDMNKMWFAFMSERGAGKHVTLREILKIYQKPIEKRSEVEYRDITTSNLIVGLSEILTDIEDLFEREIKGSSEYLRNNDFDKIDMSMIKADSNWARKKIESGQATLITIRNLVLELKEELKRGLEIYKLLHPIYKEMYTIISLMPHLLTMLYEDRENISKIRQDCNNIFAELSMGADLERVASNLKEKIIKKRDVEDIRVNVIAIKKLLNKIKDALNFMVFSNLRRLKIKTVIDEQLVKDAEEIGLQLEGLTVKYGHVDVPSEYREYIIHAVRKFSDQLFEYKKIVQIRLAEEIGIKYKPSLNDLNRLIEEVQQKIERYYLIVPNHIGPLFASALKEITNIINNLNQFLKPLKDNLLKQIIDSETKKAEFYSKIKEYYDLITEKCMIFKDFVDLGLQLTSTDGRMALEFVQNVLNKEYYDSEFENIFQNSIREVKRLLAMNSITLEIANSIIKRIEETKQFLQKFIKKYDFEQFKELFQNHEFYKKKI
ncbi:MAG: hypothetical protein ACTSRZ_11795 [Promethearchaeota archaeon]